MIFLDDKVDSSTACRCILVIVFLPRNSVFNRASKISTKENLQERGEGFRFQPRTVALRAP